jgi:hypothetical protein
MCDKLSEMHHIVSPLSSTDDENDENPNELMESERHITVSSPDSSESSLQSSSPQTKPLSTAQSMQSNDEHDEHNHQTENGMHFILNRKNRKVIKLL